MAYTTIKKSSEHFNTKLYTGDGSSSRSITGVNFQPDWTWVKSRNTADYDHMITDVVRGAPKMLKTNSTAAEDSNPGAGGIGSFDSDGFTIATGSINNTNMNNNGTTYVGWNWKANGTGSANTDGSISSTVSANATSGFSIVSWTHNGSANYTVGHGLGATPKMILAKTTSASANWDIYHANITSGNRLILNSTGGQVSGYWGANTVNNNTFSIGSDLASNGTTMIAYCFAEKQGFSKFGSYTGNGNADGTFVYLGFKPAFILWKKSSASGNNWSIFDNKRDTYNATNHYLLPNLNNAEGTSDSCDLLSNGFKWRSTDGGSNGSGNTFIYMAFAEEPLVGDNPATAR